MTVIGLDGVTVRYGDRVILDAVTLGVEPRDRVGVIGVNGSGKSTLLRVAAGELAPDAGSVVHARDVRMHRLAQEPDLDEAATPRQVVLAAETPAAAAARRFGAASAAVRRGGGADAVAELEAATEAMDAAGGWDVDSRAMAALDRLGVDRVDEPVAGRSGGERKRVALAAALADPPDVLVLDEPTNHLDVDAVEWLEGQLRSWSGALLLVTHDRYLLDAVATRIVEVAGGGLRAHAGGYASYLEAREVRREQAEAEARRSANRARAELAYLRQGPKARTSKAKHRVRQAHDALDQARASKEATEVDEVELALPTPRLGTKVVNLHRAGVQLGPRWVLAEIDWKLKLGERTGVVGPNGAGKTTLLRLLAGELDPQAGSRRAGETVRVGIYRQTPEPLPPRTRVRDLIEAEVRSTQLTSGHRVTAGQLLERFLFDARQQKAYVDELSGGERRRLELLRVLAGAPNLLLLDEPTNDLDLDTLAALEEHLEGWPGALVVASHDRFLLDRVCGDVVAIEAGRLRHFPGGWRQWREVHVDARKPARPVQERGASEPPPDRGRAARPRKRTYNEERERAEAEQRLGVLSAQRDRLNAELSAGRGDHTRQAELARELAAVDAEIARLEERWLELELIGEES